MFTVKFTFTTGILPRNFSLLQPNKHTTAISATNIFCFKKNGFAAKVLVIVVLGVICSCPVIGQDKQRKSDGKYSERELDSLYVVNMMTNGKMIRLPKKKKGVKQSIKHFRRAIVLEGKIADVAGDVLDVQAKISALRLKIVEEYKSGKSQYVIDKISNLEYQIADEQEKIKEIEKEVSKIRKKRNDERERAEQLFLLYMMKSNKKKQLKPAKRQMKKTFKRYKTLNKKGLW